MYSARKVLADHKITSAELARRMNVTPMNIHMTLKHNPTVQTLHKYAEVIGADPLEFFTPLSKDDPRLAPLLHQFE